MTRSRSSGLGRLRAGIDAVDDGVVRLLARRRKLALELAKVKKALKIPIYDPRREAALLARVKGWGRRHKLDAKFVEAVFRLIVGDSKKVQRHARL